MPRYRLKISERDFRAVQEAVFSDLPDEAGAFLLAGVARYAETVDILVRRVVPIPSDHFVTQNRYRLEVSTQAINGLIGLCEANGLGALLCHSHPTASLYSASDDHGEKRIFEVLRHSIPAEAPTASLLLYPGGADARVWVADQSVPQSVEELIVIGDRIEKRPLHSPCDDRSSVQHEMFSRQVLALGEPGQRALAATKVAIVGVGGTGSACAEQLARLGVADFVLIDHDDLEGSNLTRVYGAFAKDVRRRMWPWNRRQAKVAVVGRHLRRINPRSHVKAINDSVVKRHSVQALMDRDVIFLCTDDHWGRSVVNDLTHQYLIPSINTGVRIDAKASTITGATGIVDILRPDVPCLWCKSFLRSERIAAESMPDRERLDRAREGYVEGVDTPAPSVVSLTTTVAGLAVTNFIHLVTGFLGDGDVAARLNYHILENAVTGGASSVASRCVCRQKKGFGDLNVLRSAA